MNREEIVDALTALAAELERRGVSAEMYVVGGAAIALAFDERRATRDIDAVFEPKGVVYEAAATVAEERELIRTPSSGVPLTQHGFSQSSNHARTWAREGMGGTER
ncbi:MAG TPA: hypothetical protein VNM89_04520 [Solirubrobacterales bacterium]|nr:hypothetical protein [Solirubrobacterales bacterium]